MIVLQLNKAPAHIMGYTSRFLSEVTPGVFIGNVSKRVEVKLWERITQSYESESFRAMLIFSSNNEVGFEMKLHNAKRKMVDFDGFMLFEQ